MGSGDSDGEKIDKNGRGSGVGRGRYHHLHTV